MCACTQMLDACRRIGHYILRTAHWKHTGTLTACRIVKYANKSEELKPWGSFLPHITLLSNS